MRQEIEDYMLECGFEKINTDTYKKEFQRPVGEVIMNGERKIKIEKLEFCIQYIGEGL